MIILPALLAKYHQQSRKAIADETRETRVVLRESEAYRKLLRERKRQREIDVKERQLRNRLTGSVPAVIEAICKVDDSGEQIRLKGAFPGMMD